MADHFPNYLCPECASLLQELEDAQKAAPPVSVVLEQLEETVREASPSNRSIRELFEVSRRMEQHEMRTGHSLAALLRSKLPNWPYLG